MDTIKLFKALSDKSRLAIISNLMEGPMYVELMAQRLGLTPSTISFHLKKLEDAGLVTSRKEQYYQVFELNQQLLSLNLADVILANEREEAEETKREEEYRKKVIASFFEYGKLKSVPVQQKKAVIIYEEIAKAFETDRIYTEREVNILIADFHDDFCTIRKNMVAAGILDRNQNGYWRKKKQDETQSV